jgi:hypothetical protein
MVGALPGGGPQELPFVTSDTCAQRDPFSGQPCRARPAQSRVPFLWVLPFPMAGAWVALLSRAERRFVLT